MAPVRRVTLRRDGEPLLPFAHDSSFGCAICDPVIALLCFSGGPSVADVARRWSTRDDARRIPGSL
jgi:hypothetical protein